MGDKGRRMVESIVIELTAKGKRSFPGRTMGVAALGIPPETIHVTGIPIDPDFSAAREKAQTRRGLGLQPDLTTVLVSAGRSPWSPLLTPRRRSGTPSRWRWCAERTRT
jgi:hypothetical protein